VDEYFDNHFVIPILNAVDNTLVHRYKGSIHRDAFLRETWEAVKYSAGPGTTQPIKVNQITALLSDLDCEKKLPAVFDIPNVVYEAPMKRFILTQKFVDSCFDVICLPLIAYLEQKLVLPELQGLKLAILVGGCGSNSIVQGRLRDFLKQRNIHLFVAHDPSLAVVKGAVRFAFDPTQIGSRIARTNYGLGVYNREDPSKTLFELKIPKNKKLREVVKETEKTPWGPYHPPDEQTTEVVFRLWETPHEPPKFVDNSCVEVCSILVPVNVQHPMEQRSFTLTISMDGPTMTGHVQNVETKETAQLEFLG